MCSACAILYPVFLDGKNSVRPFLASHPVRPVLVGEICAEFYLRSTISSATSQQEGRHKECRRSEVLPEQALQLLALIPPTRLQKLLVPAPLKVHHADLSNY